MPQPFPTHRSLVIGNEHPFARAMIWALQQRDGADAVLAAPNFAAAEDLIDRQRPTDVYLLSAVFPTDNTGEPAAHWHRDIRQLIDVLDLALYRKLNVFYPSSVFTFGPGAPTVECSNNAFQDPMTLFGLNKRSGERWCEQYFLGHGVDVRSLRFPVIICPKPLRQPLSAVPPPVERQAGITLDTMVHQARPVLHIEDAVRATLELMAAPAAAIRERRSYNITGASLSPRDLRQELRQAHPFREIEIWNLPGHPGPVSLDDSAARSDWGWKPRYDLLRLIK